MNWRRIARVRGGSFLDRRVRGDSSALAGGRGRMIESEGARVYEVTLGTIETVARESGVTLKENERRLLAALPGLPTLPEGRAFERCARRVAEALDELAEVAGDLAA